MTLPKTTPDTDTAGVTEEALRNQYPILRRFAESRRQFAANPYRPQYHFVSPEGNLNDPNGLCFWQGR